MLKNVKQALRPIEKAAIQAYFSDKFQLFHLLEYLLGQAGKAELVISSFSFSEEFVRKLQRFKDQGMTSKITLLVDYRSASKMLHLSYFLSRVADRVYLGNNHSKIILIRSSNHLISVVTSSNLTRGNRYESGIVSTIPGVFNHLLELFEDLIKDCTKAHELFQGDPGNDPGVR